MKFKLHDDQRNKSLCCNFNLYKGCKCCNATFAAVAASYIFTLKILARVQICPPLRFLEGSRGSKKVLGGIHETFWNLGGDRGGIRAGTAQFSQKLPKITKITKNANNWHKISSQDVLNTYS